MTSKSLPPLSFFPAAVSSRVQASFGAQHFLSAPGAIPESLSSSWRQRAETLMHDAGIDIERVADGYALSYRVVTGEVIRDLWPELFHFYSSPILHQWIASVTGEPQIFVSRNIRSSININCLYRAGQSYRWHNDAIRYTVLLFLTNSVPEDGGAFELIPPQASHSSPITILPRAGDLLLMDGTLCLHRVAPLLRDQSRLSVPMVFPATADDSRPSGLDDYLYHPAAKP